MKSLVDVVNELRAYDAEREWFEFKENWFEAKALGHLSMIFNAKWQNFCIRKILMPALV